MRKYYTKEEIVRSEFIFVSYKHEDRNTTVAGVLDFLFEQGVRFWYDADLGVGLNWDEVVRDLIMHDNCVGAIFFNSVESFTSEAVHKERGFALEKLKQCQSTGKVFRIFPVNIGRRSVLELIRAVFEAYPGVKELQEKCRLEYLRDISNLFPSNTTYRYADPEDQAGYMNELLDMIARELPKGVIDKNRKQMMLFEQSGIALPLGICKDKPSGAVPPALLEKDGPVHLRNGSFVVEDHQAFTVKKIQWRLLYCRDKRYVFAAENAQSLRNGGRELKEWLQQTFVPTAFTEEEQKKLLEIRLLTLEDVQYTDSPEKLIFAPDATNPEGHWWMDAMAQGALQKVIKKDGSVFHIGYNMRTKKSGVRPVIVIDHENLSGILENN